MAFTNTPLLTGTVLNWMWFSIMAKGLMKVLAGKSSTGDPSEDAAEDHKAKEKRPEVKAAAVTANTDTKKKR